MVNYKIRCYFEAFQGILRVSSWNNALSNFLRSSWTVLQVTVGFAWKTTRLFACPQLLLPLLLPPLNSLQFTMSNFSRPPLNKYFHFHGDSPLTPPFPLPVTTLADVGVASASRSFPIKLKSFPNHFHAIHPSSESTPIQPESLNVCYDDDENDVASACLRVPNLAGSQNNHPRLL